MIYSILDRNVNIEPEVFFHHQLSSTARGHSLKLFEPHAQNSVHSNFFSINPWNDLPNEVFTSNSVNNFKILLDRFHHE